jgi:hypothetical protein
MKVVTAYNNFSRGKIDGDMSGRWDLPIYSNGADVFKNFFSDFKGSGRYRPGLEMMLKYEDAALIEFKFNNAQTYIVVITATVIRFVSYDVNGVFGWVESSPGVILELVSPYTLAQAKKIANGGYAQNADVMTLCHNSVVIKEIIRVSATSFTIGDVSLTASPFDDPVSGAVGQPAGCCYYKGRIFYFSPGKAVTTVYGSKADDHYDMTVGTADTDGLEFTISEITEPLLWMKDGNNSLITGSSQAIAAINGGDNSKAITPTTVEATITNTDGSEGSIPIRKDNLLFYIDSLGRRVKYFSYDLLTESFISEDANFVSYDITKGTISNLVYIKDRNDLIFSLRNDGYLVSLCFNLKEKIIGWHEHPTNGEVLQICHMNDNSGNAELFALVERDTGIYIERLAKEVEFESRPNFYTGDNNEAEDDEAYYKYIAEQLKECVYLDNCNTFRDEYTSTIVFSGGDTITSTANDFSAGDVGKWIVYKTETGREFGIFKITGYTSAKIVTVEILADPTANTYSAWYKTASTLTGLTDYIGKEVSVVADGGYIGEFTVDGSGELNIGKQATVIRFGYKYRGDIKTFPLGFQIQGINTQVTMKSLVRAGVRFISSAGGRFGTSMYRMEDIQDFNPSGFYDLPPLPMNDIKSVQFDDSLDINKCLYIQQDKPLPLTVTSVFAEIEYGTKT